MNADDIVILFGGDSGERRVSVASAQHIAAVLADARPWFVTPAGAVHECPREWLARHDRPFERDLEVPGAPAHPTLDAALDSPGARDRVFVLGFHGGAGENGTVQRALEVRGLAFTGSGS